MSTTKLNLPVIGAVMLLSIFAIIGVIVVASSSSNSETGDDADTAILCENGEELYYEDPGTREGSCVQSGIQGPCGNNMIIVTADKRRGRSKGICECDVIHFERPLIYHEGTRQCHFIFTRAFCGEGEWLTVVKNQGPTCEPRRCDEIPSGELVPLKDGRCVELGRFDNVTCNKSQVVRFFRKKIHPACANLGISIGSVGLPSHDCPGGYFSTGTGQCQMDFDFD